MNKKLISICLLLSVFAFSSLVAEISQGVGRETPTPVGGMVEIKKNIHYPEIARKAGIQGTVIVKAKISEHGKVVETEVLKSLGDDNGCDESAVSAIKKVKWNPAIRNGKPVSAWVTIPMKFKLDSNNSKSGQVPPPPPSGSDAKKVDYDVAPKPVGGFVAIRKYLAYPDAARKAGIIGKVMLNVHIDKNGNTTEVKIFQSLDKKYGCDKAAVAAIKKTKWKPAQKAGEPIAVWVVVPVAFSLK